MTGLGVLLLVQKDYPGVITFPRYSESPTTKIKTRGTTSGVSSEFTYTNTNYGFNISSKFYTNHVVYINGDRVFPKYTQGQGIYKIEFDVVFDGYMFNTNQYIYALNNSTFFNQLGYADANYNGGIRPRRTDGSISSTGTHGEYGTNTKFSIVTSPVTGAPTLTLTPTTLNSSYSQTESITAKIDRTGKIFILNNAAYPSNSGNTFNNTSIIK